eukprot:Filipodium_phascolosomae@DN2577_c0_g1_i6.p3
MPAWPAWTQHRMAAATRRGHQSRTHGELPGYEVRQHTRHSCRCRCTPEAIHSCLWCGGFARITAVAVGVLADPTNSESIQVCLQPGGQPSPFPPYTGNFHWDN